MTIPAGTASAGVWVCCTVGAGGAGCCCCALALTPNNKDEPQRIVKTNLFLFLSPALLLMSPSCSRSTFKILRNHHRAILRGHLLALGIAHDEAHQIRAGFQIKARFHAYAGFSKPVQSPIE